MIQNSQSNSLGDSFSQTSFSLKSENEVSRARLNQIFNTALVNTRAEEQTEVTEELYRLMELPAFGCVLKAIQSLAAEQGSSEIDAAREVIRTFRRVDRIWSEYLIQEGVERLKGSH